MSMKYWYRFWRRFAALVFLNAPLRSYGELVLRPAAIAERGLQKTSAASAGHNER